MVEWVRSMSKTMLALFSAGALSCTQDGISGACTAFAAVGLTVNVTNAATTQPLCDAKVTATDGAYSEQLFQASCSYAGAIERPGTYTVRAERPGFVSKEVRGVQVVMGSGQCPHVQEVRLAIPLVPDD
jgi:hypothetical protein